MDWDAWSEDTGGGVVSRENIKSEPACSPRRGRPATGAAMPPGDVSIF